VQRPVILDLFCGAGGASKGYHDAGFDVVGVDIENFKRYPFKFVQADAIDFLDTLVRYVEFGYPIPYEAIHASPPCQAFTQAKHVRPENEHPDLIGPTRERLDKIGLPYIIENVVNAPLIDPVTLCGGMFPGLRVYRHRLFETNWPLPQPVHPPHTAKITKMGRPPQPDEFMHVVGHFAGVKAAREAMGIDWMTRNELKEAIPPAYTEYIGRELRKDIGA
jgi:DNA (cytosine-5)-methyltransferase 1